MRNDLRFTVIAAMLLPSVFIGKTMAEERDSIPLPPPRFDSDYSVEQALLNRRSVRDYSNEALSQQELAQLLWACQGISKIETWKLGRKDAQFSYRTAPSAGALYPLEVYVLVKRVDGLDAGLYCYRPGPGIDNHALEQRQKGDRSAELARAAQGQRAVTKAAANIIIGGIIDRTAAKYGDRARRYVLIEVGHAAENLCLQAPGLGIGAVPIGAFSDDKLRKFVDDDVEPFYILSVGKNR